LKTFAKKLILICLLLFLAGCETTGGLSKEDVVSNEQEVSQKNSENPAEVQVTKAKPEVPESIEELRNKAKSGDQDAALALGMMYFNGQGVPKDERMAGYWLHEAVSRRYTGPDTSASEGSPEAQLALGKYYSNSQEFRSLRRAQIWLSKAAKSGSKEAEKLLVQLKVDVKKGKFQKDPCSHNKNAAKTDSNQELTAQCSVEAGDPEALVLLGRRYFHGLGGIERDRAKGAACFRKAAEQGYAEAQYELGLLYATHQGGVPHNQCEALKWWRKAALNGNGNASYNLARYSHSENPKEAEKWYRKGAEQGNQESIAALKKMYAEGLIVKNEELSQKATEVIEECNRLAAYPGSPVTLGKGVAFAQLNAEVAIRACGRAVIEKPHSARLHFQLGRALNKNKRYSDAFAMFKIAAKQGYAPAQYNLAIMHWNGLNHSSSRHVIRPGTGSWKPYIALKWFRKSAEQGHAHAQNQMGYIYENYWMDPKVMGEEPGAKARGFWFRGEAWDKAMEWYHKAANQGLRLAEDNIAALHLRNEREKAIAEAIADNPPPEPGPFDCHLGAMWNC
jgi:TPR repeat protein